MDEIKETYLAQVYGADKNWHDLETRCHSAEEAEKLATRNLSIKYTGYRIIQLIKEEINLNFIDPPKELKPRGLQQLYLPAEVLVPLVGSDPIPKTEIIKVIWNHIKKYNLQNPLNKREILTDEILRPIFGGKSKLTMFEIAGHLNDLVTKLN